MTRRRAVVAALVAVAALLAGCVGIPTSGGVGTEQIAANPDANDVGYDAALPVKGMSPGEIVAGFLAAGRDPRSSYQVAKEYLADDLRSQWKPNAGVLVSDSPIAAESDGDDDYTVALTVTGQIDQSGIYTPQKASSRELPFRLAKNGAGQWRITQAPDGTVLRPGDFGPVIRDYTLYFYDPGYQYLVPDLRWFADNGTAGFIPGRIVGALLAGPAPWLASPVLVSAFPNGTQAGDVPTIDAGTVTVDLSSQVLSANATQQERMLQQLTWSLRSLAVSDVTMTVSGLPLQVADTGGINPDISPQYEAIGSDGKSFGALTTGGVTAFSGLGAQVMSLGPTAATLSHDRGVAAVLGGSGVSIVGATANPVLVDPRTGSVAPSLDPDGYAWSDPPGDPSALVVVKSDAKQHTIPIPVSGRVVSLAVSRDGTRLLVALSTDSGPRLVVTGIQRDKDDAPVGFGPLVDLPVGGGALLGATWLDANSVAALSSGTDGATDVVEYAISGQTTPHGSVPGGQAIAGGSDGIRLLDSSGSVLQPSLAEGWQSAGLHASFLGTQQ